MGRVIWCILYINVFPDSIEPMFLNAPDNRADSRSQPYTLRTYILLLGWSVETHESGCDRRVCVTSLLPK